jgi:hypothetical protein
MATPDTVIEDLTEVIASKLIDRGFLISAGPTPAGITAPDYDDATCRQFFSPEHIGDNVLRRAHAFFGELEQRGELTSLDVVALLGIKGPRSIPANLTNPLKKSQHRLGLPKPWIETENADGTRTIWEDRDGIASRMAKAAEKERRVRGI